MVDQQYPAKKIVRSSDKKQVDMYELVLTSMGIDYHSYETNGKWIIEVAENHFETALKEIKKYEKENHEHRKRFRLKYKLADLNIAAFLLIPIMFYLFYIAEKYFYQYEWSKYGAANADKILSGEWWRAVSALTLHADMQHLNGNMLMLGIIAFALNRMVGSGLGWFIILLSGFFGNYLNALGFLTNHYSIGSSTAVFGAIGILGSIQLFGRYKSGTLKKWLPLAGAAGLLAVLGVSGQNTDVGAHFCGFFVGVVLGVAAAFLSIFFLFKNIILQFILGLSAFLLLVGSWVLAFN